MAVLSLPLSSEALAKEASPSTKAQLASFAKTLPWSDSEDFKLAARGLIAEPERRIITMKDGRVVRDLRGWSIFEAAAPDTVNPSLWRQSRLLARAGLYKVADRVYQVRGLDVSNMTLIVGDRGYIVVDTLMTAETAHAALALVRRALGNRPITAIIYTHSHVDHYGGAAGVVDAAGNSGGALDIIAPQGFMKAVTDENLIAGPAMSRRLQYQLGTKLPYGPEGAIGAGGFAAYTGGLTNGTVSLVPPTRLVDSDQVLVIDGVRFDFQLTPGTEAPAEMNFYLPDFKVLCMAENANASLHNLLTPRGAEVRDARRWAAYLDASLERYGKRSDAVVMQHFWPRWGTANIVDFLSSQRDTYLYIHDQSVRMMNDGLTPSEIAERLELPASLGNRWYNRSYWGSLKFNAKAVFQRYLGWYDGNPAHLDQLPPKELGQRYVSALGGPAKALAEGQRAIARGDYRWAVEILTQLVMADSADANARAALADAFEQLGYQAENGPWRNSYLVAAQELRDYGSAATSTSRGASLPSSLPIEALLDIMAVRLNPAASRGRSWDVRLINSEDGQAYHLSVANDVFRWQKDTSAIERATTMRLSAAQMRSLLDRMQAGSGSDAKPNIGREIDDFFGIFVPPRQNFPIVTRP